MSANQLLPVFLFVFLSLTLSAQTARIKGVILDKNNQPVENVNVSYSSGVTRTNENGFYNLKIPANQQVTLVFTHVSLKKITVIFSLDTNEQKEFNPVMSDQEEQMGEVIVTSNNRKQIQGITAIEPEMIRKIPGANAGIENIL